MTTKLKPLKQKKKDILSRARLKMMEAKAFKASGVVITYRELLERAAIIVIIGK